jgi:hypothetical protein
MTPSCQLSSMQCMQCLSPYRRLLCCSAWVLTRMLLPSALVTTSIPLQEAVAAATKLLAGQPQCVMAMVALSTAPTPARAKRASSLLLPTLAHATTLQTPTATSVGELTERLLHSCCCGRSDVPSMICSVLCLSAQCNSCFCQYSLLVWPFAMESNSAAG